MSWTETLHDDAGALAETLATRLAGICRDAIAARGHAFLALAGGRTPLPIYRRLAGENLDWRAVTVIPTDERWVAHDHAASNQRELAAAFADATGIRLGALVPAHPGDVPDTAQARLTLADCRDDFDAVLLGMGNDGHFASLFPGAANLGEALAFDNADDACVVHPDPLPPEAPFARVSLTAGRLLRSRALWLAITGERKLSVLRDAQTTRDPQRLPIAALLHAPRAHLHIHWSP